MVLVISLLALSLKITDCIFIHIPKTGGTSIGNSLYQILGSRLGLGFRPERSHLSASERRSTYMDETWNSAFKFTIIRNPWGHLVSWYHWHYGNGNVYDQYSTFESWVLAGLPTHTILDQWVYFTQDNEILVDYIGRFENLRKVLNDVTDIMGIEHIDNLRHEQKAPLRNPYQAYYTPKTRQIVADRFSVFIDRFSYIF